MNNQFQIRVHSGSLRGQAFVINKQEFKVGRDPSCDIVLNENAVSRIHLLIYPQAYDAIVLVDNNSTNGTTVNNVQVTAPVQIAENDVIMLGGEVALVLEKVPAMQSNSAQFNQQSTNQGYGIPQQQVPQYQPPVSDPAANENYPQSYPQYPAYPMQNVPVSENQQPAADNSNPETYHASANYAASDLEKVNYSGTSAPPSEAPGSGNMVEPYNPASNAQGYTPQSFQPPSGYQGQEQAPYYPNQSFNPRSQYPAQAFPNQGQQQPYYSASQYPGTNQQYPMQSDQNQGQQQPYYPASQYPGMNQQYPMPSDQNQGQQQPYYPASQYPGMNPQYPPYGASYQDGSGQQVQQQGYPYQQQQYPAVGYYGQQPYPNYEAPAEYETEEKSEEDGKRKRLFIILGIVLVLILAIVGFIIYIDSNYLWCDVFPFLWSAEACAIYP